MAPMVCGIGIWSGGSSWIALFGLVILCVFICMVVLFVAIVWLLGCCWWYAVVPEWFAVVDICACWWWLLCVLPFVIIVSCCCWGKVWGAWFVLSVQVCLWNPHSVHLLAAYSSPLIMVHQHPPPWSHWLLVGSVVCLQSGGICIAVYVAISCCVS